MDETSWRRYLRFWGTKVEADVDDELRFHFDMRVQEYVARGMNEEEARAAVVRRLGDVAQAKVECKTIGHRRERLRARVEQLDTLVEDARYAVRSLAKSPAFVAAVVLTLGLGIAVTTAAFSAVNRLILHSLPFANEDRLMMLSVADSTFGSSGWPNAGTVGDWQQHARSFDAIGLVALGGVEMTTPDGLSAAYAADVSPSLLTTLGVRPIIGRPFSDADVTPGAPPVVLLAEGFWSAHFGRRADVLGTTLVLNDTARTVIGVLPKQLSAIALYQAPQVWVPLNAATDALVKSRQQGVLAIGRLKPGVATARAEAELDLIVRQRDIANGASPSAAPTWRAQLLPPSELLAPNLRNGLWVLFGAAGLVMLIACANVANLQLVRSARRASEIAVRAALGASRARLVRQLFVESAMLTVAGCALGVALGAVALRAVVALRPGQLFQLDVLSFDRPVLFFALGIGALTSMLYGMAPAWRASNVRLAETMRGVSATGGFRGRHRLQSALVVSEIALSLMLLVGAGLLTRSFVNLQEMNPGFSPGGLVELAEFPSPKHFPDSVARSTYWKTLLQRVLVTPGVETAVLSTSMPSRLGTSGYDFFQVADRQLAPVEGHISVSTREVSAEYFQVMRSQLRAGRTFLPTPEADDPNAVVLGAGLAARLWPGEDPIGMRLRRAPRDSWHTVIGVIADQGLVGPSSAPYALQLYFPTGALDPDRIQGLLIRVRDGVSVRPVAAALTAIGRSMDPRVIAGEATAETTLLDQGLGGPRFSTRLLTAFALLAVMLAALGVYAVIAYAVSQRTHEIGVRVALGARRGDVIRLVLGDGLRLATIGMIIGLVGAFAAARLLGGLLYEENAHDPAIYAAIPVVLAVVALLASYLPALRAARVDPVRALRHE